MQIKILETSVEKNLAFELRKEVFVKEQNVPIDLELDDKDNLETTVHVGLFDNKILVGVARILDINTDHVHIGRVAINKNYRGRGLGKNIILGCHDIIKKLSALDIIFCELSAQIQAENFYKKLGYERVNNNIYLDAGIEHIDMEIKLKK